MLKQKFIPLHTTVAPEETFLSQETEEPNDKQGDEPTEEQKTIITKNYYYDGKIEITLTQYREFNSDIYVAEVKLSSAEYLKTALADDTYGKNIVGKTSDIAYLNNAVFAVNGDFYGAQEEGYVIKNGILYRNIAVKKQEDLVIYRDGSFDIILETEVPAEEVFKKGAYQLLSFGPSLIYNGEITNSKNYNRGATKTNNPRTAIGIIDRLHYIFVVCDGRTDYSEGLTVSELADFMLDLGAVTAYNLDGGGSATMYFNGKVVNMPTFNGKEFKERNVSDIVYIGY